MKHNFFLLLLFAIVTDLYAQKVKPFFGMSMNIDAQFKTHGFYNIISGADFKVNEFLRPEFKIGYIVGSIESQIDSDINGNITSIFERSVSAIYIGFSPKVILFEGQDENYYFQLFPEYDFARIESIGKYLEPNVNLSNSQIQKISDTQNFFGIGIGICLYVSEKHHDVFAFNIYYQGINLGTTLTRLNFNNQEFNTKDAIGFGINYYY